MALCSLSDRLGVPIPCYMDCGKVCKRREWQKARDRKKSGAVLQRIESVTVSGVSTTTPTFVIETLFPLDTTWTVGVNYATGTRANLATLDPDAGSNGNASASAGTTQTLSSVDFAAGGLSDTVGEAATNCAAVHPWIEDADGNRYFFDGGIAWIDDTTDTLTGCSVPPVEAETGTYNHGIIIASEGATAPLTENGAASLSTASYTFAAGDVGNTVTFTCTVTAGTATDSSSFTTGTVVAAGVVVLGTAQYFFANQVGASSTSYVSVEGSQLNATEDNVKFAVSDDVTFSDLEILTGSTQPATGSLVFTLRKNGVDTAITKTIAASDPAAAYNATGSVAFSAGDLLSISVVNNASGNSAQIRSIYLKGA